MADLDIKVRNDQTHFSPGETFEAKACWRLDGPAKAVELKFLWTATRKAEEKRSETVVVDRIRIQNPVLSEDRSFKYSLPDRPYSFSGKYFSLCWSFELSVEPDMGTCRTDFTLSPTGGPVVLGKKPRQERIGSNSFFLPESDCHRTCREPSFMPDIADDRKQGEADGCDNPRTYTVDPKTGNFDELGFTSKFEYAVVECPVPEPGTIMTLGAGLLLLAGIRWKMRK